MPGPWRDVACDWGQASIEDREQHYAEFLSFMPDVQRFLYGEGIGASALAPAIRVFRRDDVASARVTLRSGDAPIVFAIPRVELYFFHDIDLAILAVEFCAQDLGLASAQDALFRIARAYPASWDEAGYGLHCCNGVELLDSEGRILATADYADKQRFISAVCDRRSAEIAAHWAWLLTPLVPAHGAGADAIAFQLIEQERIPLLGFLACDDPQCISRDDWVRLGLAAAPGKPGDAPFGARYIDDFEARYCYDRFWDAERGHDHIATRMICSGYAFLMVGDAANPRFIDAEHGILAKFRHQYFLLALIAHFHRAALMVFRDRLVTAMGLLADYAPETVKRFKREIRLIHENFLRFTHRYWFSEVTTQGPAHDIFARWSAQLGTEALFHEVREEVNDMMDYLDSDGLRRQANSVVRLTVVTFFGLIGTVATGVLGMNIFDFGHAPVLQRLLLFVLVFIPVAALTFYTAAKSQRLSEFLEAFSDRRLSMRAKLLALVRVWRRG
ncbi:hypothetical protein [Sphingobium sp.]|uniref:hypothetical protein n=1 Tax=Sphingobium sp. TaxID=1912891 RepID=UPI0028BF3F86|nr:hypothetical protein [Sphingobium sp.]